MVGAQLLADAKTVVSCESFYLFIFLWDQSPQEGQCSLIAATTYCKRIYDFLSLNSSNVGRNSRKGWVTRWLPCFHLATLHVPFSCVKLSSPNFKNSLVSALEIFSLFTIYIFVTVVCRVQKFLPPTFILIVTKGWMWGWSPVGKEAPLPRGMFATFEVPFWQLCWNYFLIVDLQPPSPFILINRHYNWGPPIACLSTKFG